MTGFGMYVTLTSSGNEYLTYPCEGYLQVLEYGLHGGIIHASFRVKLAVKPADGLAQCFSAPVQVERPVFTYDPDKHGYNHFMECRRQWEALQANT